MDDERPPGRREQHRDDVVRRTRHAARELFAAQGYAGTTVREIADRAGINERTFYRFFPAKEDIVLGEVRDLIPAMSAALRARPPGEPPLTAIRAALDELAGRTSVPLTLLVTGVPDRDGPTSKPRRALLIDFEDQLATDLTERYGDDPEFTELHGSVVARAVLGALRAALIEHVRLRELGTPVPVGRTVTRAFDILQRIDG